jgi:outer membrane receptor protein involved in Fe transport
MPEFFVLHSNNQTHMKTFTFTLLALAFSLFGFGQDIAIEGKLLDQDGNAVIYANVSLHIQKDSALFKVEASNEDGVFYFKGVKPDAYYLKATSVGFDDLTVEDIKPGEGEIIALGDITLSSTAIDLQTATVTASRAIVEVKPDRTVFNVQGTINSAGDNAIGLLRKAPGVLVDNNDNISVLGRSGVLLYVDGKRLPLSGDDLTNYLESLPAEQIDRMDIITNPGAKYEAEGNAGIIDIRLKKDKNLGANGTVSSNFSQGIFATGNLNVSGNYRNKRMNVFGNVGLNSGHRFHKIDFVSLQNGIQLAETNRMHNDWSGYDFRLGTDFFLDKNHTIGFMVSGRQFDGNRNSLNRIEIAPAFSGELTDSILVANNTADETRTQQTYNLNYQFQKGAHTLNMDADYGSYRNTSIRLQPNLYYDAGEEVVLTEVITGFDTPRDIDIYTFKADYEVKLGKGNLGIGTKLSKVATDNTFLFYDQVDGIDQLNNRKSNQFFYDEKVYAGYLNFSSPLGEKFSFSAGLRAEQTDATGDLQTFLPDLQEAPVDFTYLSWFPSAGLTYQVSKQNTLSLNYGRRINRPDYNVLNPFNNQLSELSFMKGNPFLQPEIVNNVELGYTLAYRYNFKIAYSYTTDQITRLIAPSDDDERANFITWANLANQTIFSVNISAPIQVTKAWNAFINITGSHLDNQADYGDGAVVDVQAWTYSIFQQHTIDLFKGLKGEISGYYSGPGVWGGVFKYESNWSLNLGLQKRFFNNKLNAKLAVNDIFYESGWSGFSDFNGLYSAGSGSWDSRRASLSLSYNFGNQNVKARKRKSGLEDESKRIGE